MHQHHGRTAPFFKTHRQRYYDLLQKVRAEGDWESWLDFFLDGVSQTSNQAAETARVMLALFDADRAKIEGLGRPAASALRVYHLIQKRPFLAIPAAAEGLKLSEPTVAKSVQHLMELGILAETTGKMRKRLYVYTRYLDILSQGTEPLPR